jgi:hypothetical protein
MLLKRIYKAGGMVQGVKDGQPYYELDYISLAHTGVNPEQNFSIQLVTEGLKSGSMEIHDAELILRVHPEDLRYTIKRTPGRWCLHCGKKLPDDTGGEMARLHIAQYHAGTASPDPSTPSGYVALNHFECVLNDKQHKKFRVKQPTRAPQFPLKEQV